MADQPIKAEEKPQDEVDPAYRQWLVAAEQKAQEDFDKTVLALSGGALGISFVFVKDIVGSNPIHQTNWLVLAWVAWALSTFAVLASFFLSRQALRRAIEQCDDGTIFCQPPGGFFSKATRWLNASGAVLFFMGVCLMAAFVYKNLANRDSAHDRQKTNQSATTPAAPARAPPAP